MFKVISKYNEVDKEMASTFNSLHLIERNPRISAYKHLMSDMFIQCFIVDTNHPNGVEIHCINENGLIYIYNRHLMRLITILHPRPFQITRYYKQLELTVSREIEQIIKDVFKRNVDHNLNEV